MRPAGSLECQQAEAILCHRSLHPLGRPGLAHEVATAIAFLVSQVINRHGVAGAVLQTPSSLIDRLSDPFPPNLQNTINHKPLELGT